MRAHNEDILLGEKGTKDVQKEEWVTIPAHGRRLLFCAHVAAGCAVMRLLKFSVWSRIKYGDDNYHIMINDVREHLKAQKV